MLENLPLLQLRNSILFCHCSRIIEWKNSRNENKNATGAMGNIAMVALLSHSHILSFFPSLHYELLSWVSRVNTFSVFLEHAWVGADLTGSFSNGKASPYPRTGSDCSYLTLLQRYDILVLPLPSRNAQGTDSLISSGLRDVRCQVCTFRCLDISRFELQSQTQFSILLDHASPTPSAVGCPDKF